jgi:hypothetical protein
MFATGILLEIPFIFLFHSALSQYFSQTLTKAQIETTNKQEKKCFCFLHLTEVQRV